MNSATTTFRRRAAQTLTGALAVALIGTAAAAPAHADSLGSDSTESTSTGSDSTGSLATGQQDSSAGTRGAITQYYAAHKKLLGQPVSTMVVEDYWIEQEFTGGRVVTSKDGGTHVIKAGYDKIFQSGGGVRRFGVPVDDDHKVDGVYRQNFVESDSWDYARKHNLDPRSTYHWVFTWGLEPGGVKRNLVMYSSNVVYTELGGTDGKLGVPKDGFPQGMSARDAQSFQHGVIAGGSGNDGHPVHSVFYGPIYDAWNARGAGSGSWGFPTTEAKVLPDGTTEQYFEHALVHVSHQGKVTTSDYSRTYTHRFGGAEALARVAAAAGFEEHGVFPASTWDVGPQRSYTYYSYMRGIVLYTKEHGYVAISEEVMHYYVGDNGTADTPELIQRQARLGDPVSFTYDSKLGLTTHFEHGSLRYDEKTKKVVETK